MGSDTGVIRGQPEQEDLGVNVTTCCTTHALFRPSAGKVESHNVLLVLSPETETSAWIGDVI